LSSFSQQFSGSFSIDIAAQTSTTTSPRFRPGYIAPKRKKKKVDEPPAVVEIAVEKKQVKYVSVRQPVFGPSMAPVMAAVDDLVLLIQARARHAEIQRRITELEEEEDIIIILSQLQ
jgi:hypothetical protein